MSSFDAPPSPSAAAVNFVGGFTRKLMNYVAGSSPSAPSSADLELSHSGRLVSSDLPQFQLDSNMKRRQSFTDLASAALSRTVKHIAGTSSLEEDLESKMPPTGLFAVNISQPPVSAPVPGSISVEEQFTSYQEKDKQPFASVTASNSIVEQEKLFVPSNAVNEPQLDKEDKFYDDGEVVVNFQARSPQALPKIRTTPRRKSMMKVSTSLPSLDKLSLENSSNSASVQSAPVGMPPSESFAPLQQADPKLVAAEFDPIIPDDWMMNFNSPSRHNVGAVRRSGMPSSYSNPTLNASPCLQKESQDLQNTPSNKFCLIDTLTNDFVTPRSIKQYSDRDLDQIKESIKKESEQELAQRNAETETKLAELTKSFETIKSERDNLSQQVQALQEQKRASEERMEIKISKAQEETARTQSQLSQIESSFAELRHKYEEMKHSLNSAVKNEQVLQDKIQTYRKDVQISEQRVAKVKEYAEKKLAEANEVMEKTRQKYSAENEVLKIKLEKAEMTIKSLEVMIEQKTNDYERLSKMNDDLMKKFNL